ncbi:MAG: L-seryl-tRNA(Sec) selenium transferase [Planctomycetes bacterium]|nr:L-seryl-tRNA(Sec) selenium transferase [Planctomycetota bacterium]
MTTDRGSQYQALPAVGDTLQQPFAKLLIERFGRDQVVRWIRTAQATIRQRITDGECRCDRDTLQRMLQDLVHDLAGQLTQHRLRWVINATGVLLHTGLGRAPLSRSAAAAALEAAQSCNLEVDLESGERRQRGYQLEDAWRTLTGAEAAFVVNNNAAATLLALQALCAGREVIISRGQLIEIGGSFRLPEIFALSGTLLREVGTTNHTRLSDYERAITPATAAILHVHPSNYRIVGFADTPGIVPLTKLAQHHGLLSIDDIGSGCLSPLDILREFPAEPSFQESLEAGADLVLGSGDKLLGGPQCGILLGREQIVNQIRQHPLARAVRIDKLTLAALAGTLDSYLQGRAQQEIPLLQMLSVTSDTLRNRATSIRNQLPALRYLSLDLLETTSPVGGGTLPAVELPTLCLVLNHASLSSEELSRQLRLGTPAIMGRCQFDRVLLDLRSVLPDDDNQIVEGLRQLDQKSHGHV